MKFTPHPYQQHTIDFIQDHKRAAIFLGMGMGKTISTLTALHHLIYQDFAITKALIIAPLRVARDTWPAELHKWDHLTDLTAATIIGTKAQREQALNQDADLYIVNRENIPWLVQHTWPHWPFDTVIIDELSSFKNPQAARFKALRKVLPHITRMVGLTGTPAPNSLMDIWAPFRLIDEGQRLGKFITHYRNHYFTPGKRNGPQVYTWELKPGAEEDIYQQISDITLSMKTTDYLRLPPVTTTTHQVTMTRKETRVYRDFTTTMVAELEDTTLDAANAAALQGKLQQLASGAIYTQDEQGRATGEYITVHDHKLDALEDIIEAANGNTVLVAYWFKHDAARILERFPQARALSTAEDFQDWNRQRVPVGLIHPASAGHGLNLQSGGHLLVWFTTPWSLELYEQANARLNRQGQTQPVTITHLVTAGTVDEQVHKALATKSVTQQALIDAVKANLPKP